MTYVLRVCTVLCRYPTICFWISGQLITGGNFNCYSRVSFIVHKSGVILREKIWRTPIAKCHTCCLLTCCINFENFACFPKKSKVFTFKKSQEPYSEYIFFSFQIPSCYFKNNRLKGKVEIEFFSAQFFSSKITTIY